MPAAPWHLMPLVTLSLCATPSAGPTPAAAEASVLRIFLDPQRTWVDQIYLQQQLDWVEWVRDREVASVHLIVLRQSTGGGGQRTTLRFLGLGPFAGLEDDLTLDSPPDATEDELRQALADRISLGLARYASRIPRMRPLRVHPARSKPEASAPSPARDPWNAWVFRMNGSSYLSGESRTTSASTWASVSARRITEEELFRFSANGNWSESTYQLEEGEIRSRRESYGTSLAFARAINERWTWGLLGDASKSRVGNLAHRTRVAPALEYNVWKYSESSQRQLTFLYQVGASQTAYLEETLYGKMRESLLDHSLVASLDLNQPWGTVSVSLSGSAYLHDTSKRSLGLRSNLNVKLAKGLSLNLWGSYTQVRDQLALRKGETSTEDILLRQRELQTNHQYSTSVGLSYTFGSVFNSAVNSRFRTT